MKPPIIHDGDPFNWKAGHEAMQYVQRDDGSINWGAAMAADPGCMQCHGCGEYLWREGRIVECPTCGFAWNTNYYVAPEQSTGAKAAQINAAPEVGAPTGADEWLGVLALLGDVVRYARRAGVADERSGGSERADKELAEAYRALTRVIHTLLSTDGGRV